MILSLAMLLSWTLKNPYTVCKLCNIKRVKNRHATTLNSLCCEVWSHSEVGEHLHGLVFNVSFSRDENKKIFFFFFFFIKQEPWNGSLTYFFRVTSQWPQPLRLLCLCLWSHEGEGEGGRHESEREGVLYCDSVVREIPPWLQRAMTCLITFMFDRVHGSPKLACRKWDFPSQNITLHASSKPSIKVPYSLLLCQFYRSHQATLRPHLLSHTLHRSDRET